MSQNCSCQAREKRRLSALSRPFFPLDSFLGKGREESAGIFLVSSAPFASPKNRKSANPNAHIRQMRAVFSFEKNERLA